MLSLFRNLKATVSLFQPISCSVHFTEKPFQAISEENLTNPNYIRNILDKNIIKRSKRSQRGLYHGKQIRSGNLISETDSTTRRRWKPNTHTRSFYSLLLKKKFEIEVTTKALRNIRLYGGFDNYILLTKPKNLDSVYGEYIRTLMMKKLEVPEFQVPYVVRSQPIRYRIDKRKVFFNGRPDIWYPKDLRHTDLTQEVIKLPTQMSKEQLTEHMEMINLSQNIEEASSSPILANFRAKFEEERRNLEPDRQLAIANWQKQRKKKYRIRAEEISRQAKAQGFVADRVLESGKKKAKKSNYKKKK